LLRDLREVRMAKLRDGVDVLEAGGGVQMNGVGGMEVAEGRAFIGGVVDGLRYVVFATLQLEELFSLTLLTGRLVLLRNRRDENEKVTSGKMDTREPLTMTKICCSYDVEMKITKSFFVYCQTSLLSGLPSHD
jgi:hypothetical protein